MSPSWYHNPTPQSFQQADERLHLYPPHRDVEQHQPWMEQAHGFKQGWNLLLQVQNPFLFFLSQSLPLPHPPTSTSTASARSRALSFHASWRKCSSAWLHPYHALRAAGPCPVLPGTQPCLQVLESFHWGKRDFCDLSADNAKNPRRGLASCAMLSSQ